MSSDRNGSTSSVLDDQSTDVNSDANCNIHRSVNPVENGRGKLAGGNYQTVKGRSMTKNGPISFSETYVTEESAVPVATKKKDSVSDVCYAEKPITSTKKRLRTDESGQDNTNGIKKIPNDPTAATEHGIGISNQRLSSTIPMLDTSILPDTSGNVSEEGLVITVKVPRGCRSQHGKNLSDAIEEATSRALQTLLASMSPAETATEENSPHCKDQKLDTDAVTDPAHNYDPSSFKARKRTKRSINHLDCDGSSGTVAVMETDQVYEAGLISPAIMPLKMNYIILEELLAADEAWKRQPKHFVPLSGDCYANMTDGDYYCLFQHLVSRTVKKHCRLNAFRQMPPEDRIALIKAKSYCSSTVNIAIAHDQRNKTIFVDHPGRPQICDDYTKRFPNGGHQKLHRLGSSYPDKYRSDRSLILILCAMGLFDGDHGSIGWMSIESRRHFDETSRMYSALLKEYLEKTYGQGEARFLHPMLSTWLSCVGILSSSLQKTRTFDLDTITFDVFNLQLHFLNGNSKEEGK